MSTPPITGLDEAIDSMLGLGRVAVVTGAGVSTDSDFVIPVCVACGGMLKPDVVFFGEALSAETTEACYWAVDAASALPVAASSLAVNSGMTILQRARRAAKPIVIVNRGETGGDRYATVGIEGSTSELLPMIAQSVAAGDA